MSILVDDIDVLNDNGTSKTNDILSSTCDKESSIIRQ